MDAGNRHSHASRHALSARNPGLQYAQMLFAILLSIQCLFAITPQQFATLVSEPGDSLQIKTLSASDANYSLIVINGNETFIFNPATGSEVNDSAQALRIITENVYVRADFANKLASYNATMAAFTGGKAADEAQCRQLLGTDKLPCTDRESCVRACFGVPLCEGVVNADQFWQSSRNWTNDTTNLNSAAADFSNGLDAIREGGIRVQGKIDKLDGIIALAGALYDNPVVLNRTDDGCSGDDVTKKCFEYCKHPDYRMADLVSMRQSLVKLKSDLAELAGAQARASAILSASAAQRAYLSSRGSRWDAVRSNSLSDLTRLNSTYADVQKFVRYSDAEDKIAEANGIYSQMLNLSDAGSYRAALGKEADLNAALESANAKIQGALGRRNAVLARLVAVSDKLNKSRSLIGNDSAAAVDESINSLSDQLSSTLDYGQLPGFDSAISDLDSSLNDMIVNATVSGASPEAGASTPQGTGGIKMPSSLPCPMPTGIVMGIGLLAVIAKK